MKSLTIVGGSNIVARNAIKRLAKKIDKIKLCDYRPHRPAVNIFFLWTYDDTNCTGMEFRGRIKEIRNQCWESENI